MKQQIELTKEVATMLSIECGKPYIEVLPSIVNLYCGDSELTLSEVGYLLDITRERTRQIEKMALAKLKRLSVGMAIKEYTNTSSSDPNLYYYGGHDGSRE